MWNIWGFSWEWERRRPLVAAELADLANPMSSSSTKRARPAAHGKPANPRREQVAGDTGIPLIEWIDAPTVHPTARMGPALLSRVSPVRTSRLLLADREFVPDLGFHEPWLLTTRWEIDGFRATVATTHLPAIIGCPPPQDVAVDSLAQVLAPLAGESDLLLLIGDLNLRPCSPGLRHLMQAAGPRIGAFAVQWRRPRMANKQTAMFNQERCWIRGVTERLRAS